MIFFSCHPHPFGVNGPFLINLLALNSDGGSDDIASNCIYIAYDINTYMVAYIDPFFPYMHIHMYIYILIIMWPLKKNAC